MITTDELSVVTPADWVPGPPQGSWTYDDYAALPDDGHRYEIVNGVLVMTPPPTPGHQSISIRISYYLFAHVELAGLGRVFAAPIGVELAPENMFEPDVVVILNAHVDIIAEKRIVGVPDLVVEVASPSTAAFDRLTKHDIYARSGVEEYWIVKLTSRTVEVLVLENGKYRSLGVFNGQATLPSRVIPGLPVRVEQFFV
jgi:Uma2 family endonuclease